MTTEVACNRPVYQDDSRIRCYLPAGHNGGCLGKTPPPRLTVKPHLRTVSVYEEDPNYKDVSKGDGLIYTIPTWMAEILERHSEELDGLP